MGGGALLTATLSAVVGVGTPPWPAVVAASVVGAPTGAVMALVIAAGASNKVEAFALMKVTTILGLIPVGAWFVPEPWQLVAGVVPPYWACKLWWAAVEGEAWLGYAAAGIGVSTLWLGVLTRRFLRGVGG